MPTLTDVRSGGGGDATTPTTDNLRPNEIVERVRSRIHDSHMDVERLLDDAADEIHRLREMLADAAEIIERFVPVDAFGYGEVGSPEPRGKFYHWPLRDEYISAMRDAVGLSLGRSPREQTPRSQALAASLEALGRTIQKSAEQATTSEPRSGEAPSITPEPTDA
jgi:hypothetical protein